MAKEGWKVAQHHAWAQFGRHYWRWFVFGPVIFRVVVALITAVGLVYGGMYVTAHAQSWATWLAQYLALILIFSVSLTSYAIAAFLIWRVWGWLLEVKGITQGVYTACVTSFAIIIGMCVALTAHPFSW